MGDDNSTLRSIGAAGIALLLAATLIAGVGAVSADSHDGDDGDDADEESVFPEPIEISAAGLTVSVGPPEDVDGDGIYNDLNGDSEVTTVDAVLHAVVVTAVDAGELDLTDEQAAAVDVDGDGDVDYDDAMELAMTTEMGAYATG